MRRKLTWGMMERPKFLKKLKNDFSVGAIYYPGVGDDKQLEHALGKKGVFYIDNTPYQVKVPDHNFVRGNFEKSPFRDGCFDAVFIQDIHATDKQRDELFRTLRPEGLVIYSLDNCGRVDELTPLRNNPQLKELALPYSSEAFIVFQKQTSQDLNDKKR
jgi:hypothetical protein